jgi:Tesmin/TSO1-like CXC domain, cysteine-rich domain
MERIASVPPSKEVRHVSVPGRQASFNGAAQMAVISESRYASNGQRPLSLRSAPEGSKESRDDAMPRRWDASRQTGPYQRIYHNPRYEVGPRYDPRHQHVHRHWHPQSHPRWYRRPQPHPQQVGGRGMVPISSRDVHVAPPCKAAASYGSVGSSVKYASAPISCPPRSHDVNSMPSQEQRSSDRQHSTVVIIPSNIVIPREIARSPVNLVDSSPTDQSLKIKRSSDSSDTSSSTRLNKRSRFPEQPAGPSCKFDKLDLLCSATLDLGPLQDNPTGCSCPKSKCIALYCDCFKAGRRCDPNMCTCLNCKNTVSESGPDGARSKVGLNRLDVRFVFAFFGTTHSICFHVFIPLQGHSIDSRPKS